MTACRGGHKEVVQLLIESGADLNLQNGVLNIIPPSHIPSYAIID